MTLTADELAGHYHQAWTERRPEAIAGLHTDDSAFHMHGVAPEAVGLPAVSALITSLVSLIPDLAFELKRAYVGADHIVIEYDMSGTFAGSPFVCHGADVLAVSDGLVARKDTLSGFDRSRKSGRGAS